MPSTMPEITDHETMFGRIAVEQGHITADQLVQAVMLQGRDPRGRKLGEVMLDHGLIGSDQLMQILREQRTRIAPAGASGAGAAPGSSGVPGATGAPRLVAGPRPVAATARFVTTASRPLVANGSPAPMAAQPAAPPAPAVTPPAVAPPAAPATATVRALPVSLDQLLRQAVEQGASDLHLHSGSRPRIRVAGYLREMMPAQFPAEQVRAMIVAVLSAEKVAKLESARQIDFVHQVPGVGRFRANAYHQQRGFDVVLRFIPPEPPTLQSLGLPPELAKLTKHHQGLVLITGPAGCGKTSTLAALVNLINQERPDHILTAEEPIEFVHTSKRALVNQREIGTHTESFARMLRGALREDPDVIALGDLRDHESISLALTAAETGHLVVATMHTGGAIRTINRLIGAFPPNEQDQVRVMVSESLRAIVSQRLVPRQDQRGRVAAVEILIANRAVSNLIKERKMFQIENVLQLSSGEGMCTLEQSLDRLVAAGVVTRDDANRHRAESFIVADMGAGHATK